MWDVLLIDVVSAPGVVHSILQLQEPRLFAFLLLVALLSATVLKITTVRNPPDMFRRSLPSELRLAIRHHLPCVVELVPMPTAYDHLAAHICGRRHRRRTCVRHRGVLPHGLGQMARVAVDAHGSERLGGCSGAQTPTPLEGRMARKRSTQWKMRTLRKQRQQAAEERCWKICGRRDPFCSRRNGTLQ